MEVKEGAVARVFRPGVLRRVPENPASEEAGYSTTVEIDEVNLDLN